MSYTAIVNGANGVSPTGSVKFMDGNNLLGTAALVPGANGTSSAALATKGVAVGSHPVTAEYQGDAKYAKSKSAVSVVDLDEKKDPAPNLPPNPAPTGGNLTWANFKGTKKAGDPNFDAFSKPQFGVTKERLFVTMSIDSHGMANSQCREKISSAQFLAWFDQNKSWALPDPGAPAPAKRTAYLLNHENLHLKIAEYIAAKATTNFTAISAMGGG